MIRTGKREKILKVAENLFAARPYHEVTLDEITRLARIGKGTIYLYFQDKEDLFFQTAVEGSDALCAILKGMAAGPEPFDDRLMAACRDISGFFSARKHLFRMMHEVTGRMRDAGGRMRRRFLVKKDEMVDAVAEVLSVGVAEGRLRKDIGPKVLAYALLSLLSAMNREFENSNKPSLSFITDMFLRGAAEKMANPLDRDRAEAPARVQDHSQGKKDGK